MDGRVNGNLNLSRALGDFQYKGNTSLDFDKQLIISKPDVIVKPLQGVDYIVLGCDGLFEVKSNQEIYDMVLSKKNEGLEAAVTSLIVSACIIILFIYLIYLLLKWPVNQLDTKMVQFLCKEHRLPLHLVPTTVTDQ